MICNSSFETKKNSVFSFFLQSSFNNFEEAAEFYIVFSATKLQEVETDKNSRNENVLVKLIFYSLCGQECVIFFCLAKITIFLACDSLNLAAKLIRVVEPETQLRTSNCIRIPNRKYAS